MLPPKQFNVIGQRVILTLAFTYTDRSLKNLPSGRFFKVYDNYDRVEHHL